MIQKLKEDFKALRIYAVMCGFITRNRYEKGYKKYLEASTDDEVGTFDWFIYYCKKNREFRIKYLT